MKQLIQNLKTGKLSLKDVAYPLCNPKGLIVKTVNSIISIGTERSIIDLAKKSLIGKAKARPDLFKRALEKANKEGFLKVFKESMSRLDEPFPLGYSASGTVVEIGEEVTDFNINDRVAIFGSGFANHAEYNFIPQDSCLKFPKEKNEEYIGFDEAAYCMLGGIVMQGIIETDLERESNVAVIGLGLLGLITIQILKGLGHNPIGIDVDGKKVSIAKKLGYENCISLAESNAENFVLSKTGNNGVNGVLITAATENDSPVQLAQKIAAPKGRIILVGVCDIHLDRKYFWDKELVFKVSKAAGSGDDERKNIGAFLNLISEGKVKVKELITHRINFDDSLSAYKMLLGTKEFSIGVILDYLNKNEMQEKELEESKVIYNDKVKSAPGTDKRKNVGFIGAGMFSKNILLPALTKINGINLIGVVTTKGLTSEDIASKFGFRYSTTDYKKVLEDVRIGSVFIMTRHNLHSKFVTEALEHGKDVFVEKPLCLNKKELYQIKTVFDKSKNKIMLGFNRRYSPHAKAIKKFFNDSESMVINYRVNAGFIDSENWTQDSIEGGGRIIGEVCHFVDLFQYITSSTPERIYTQGIDDSSLYKSDDNITSCIRFANSSLANITYTSKGSKAYPREIIEIYQNDSIYYLEDFKKGVVVKGNKRKNIKFFSQDMGYTGELEYFFSDTINRSDFDDYFINSLAIFAMQESLDTGKVVSIHKNIENK